MNAGPIILMGQSPPPRKPALDVLAFPPQHAREMYRLIDCHREAQAEGLVGIRAIWNLWGFIHEILPATATKTCEINSTNALHPMIEITGDITEMYPIVGKKRCTAVYHIPGPELLRLVELLDVAQRGQEARWELYAHLAKLVPETAKYDPAKGWTVHSPPGHIWVTETVNDD